MESVRDMKDKEHSDPAYIKFRCLVNNDFEEVVAYNDLVDFIEKDTTWEGVWTFEKILSHKKVRKGDKDYRGAGTNCLVLWSTGEQTSTCAVTASMAASLIATPLAIRRLLGGYGSKEVIKWQLSLDDDVSASMWSLLLSTLTSLQCPTSPQLQATRLAHAKKPCPLLLF